MSESVSGCEGVSESVSEGMSEKVSGSGSDSLNRYVCGLMPCNQAQSNGWHGVYHFGKWTKKICETQCQRVTHMLQTKLCIPADVRCLPLAPQQHILLLHTCQQ